MDPILEEPPPLGYIGPHLLPGVQPPHAGGHHHLAAARIVGKEVEEPVDALVRGNRIDALVAQQVHTAHAGPHAFVAPDTEGRINRSGLGVIGGKAAQG
jgi:hypothetical protein